MRLFLSFGVLLVVLLAVLFSARQQDRTLQPTAPAAGSAPTVALPEGQPQAVGQQVQGALDAAVQRASEAQP